MPRPTSSVDAEPCYLACAWKCSSRGLMVAKPIPEGFHTITPYLNIDGARLMMEFISKAFEGKEVFRRERPDGSIMHAEMRIGDSLSMLGEGSRFGLMPASLYLYVPDCDTVYRRALNAGGVSVFEIMTMPSGERYRRGERSVRKHLVDCYSC